MPRVSSSLYPTSSSTPTHKQVLLRVPADPWTRQDQLWIASSSLFLVGSVFWVPALYAWLLRKWRSLPANNQRQRALYGALLLAATSLAIAGPHRQPWFANHRLVRFRSWKIWSLWCRFVALEVWRDSSKSPSSTSTTTTKTTKQFHYKTDSSITAVVPHGIFPFAIGVAAIPEMAQQAFGKLRIVSATATFLFPLVRDILSMVHAVDASRPSVDAVLSSASSSSSQGPVRLGLIPGGIPEIFEGYPNKPLTHPDDEYSIVPKGFIKMALRHNIPIVPVYCFGATKLFKRLPLPAMVERVSVVLRISICLFFGVAGLPIPFRQKLLYVMGDPITPTTTTTTVVPSSSSSSSSTQQQPHGEDELVNQMHQQFCEELMRLFETHKNDYGWGHKSLHLITR